MRALPAEYSRERARTRGEKNQGALALIYMALRVFANILSCAFNIVSGQWTATALYCQWTATAQYCQWTATALILSVDSYCSTDLESRVVTQGSIKALLGHSVYWRVLVRKSFAFNRALMEP